jgi:hypothetical protein
MAAMTMVTKTDPRPEVLLSKLLALHLDLAIKRYKEPDITMSKILEAANLVAERKKAYDDRAQAIIDGVPRLDTKANAAFERPEGVMATAEQDFKDLHKTFDDVIALSNSEKNGEEAAAGSENSSTSFPAAGTTGSSS